MNNLSTKYSPCCFLNPGQSLLPSTALPYHLPNQKIFLKKFAVSRPCQAYLCTVLAADISSEHWRTRSHLAVCGFHIRGLGLVQREEIPSVGGELPDLFKGFGFVSMSACLCAYKAASMDNVD